MVAVRDAAVGPPWEADAVPSSPFYQQGQELHTQAFTASSQFSVPALPLAFLYFFSKGEPNRHIALSFRCQDSNLCKPTQLYLDASPGPQ